MKKLIVAMIMVALIAVAALTTSFLFRSDVSANNEAVITYKSVEIESGDSVWSIAEEYYSEPCGDIRDYVDEIKETNNIVGDKIIAGNYLCIPVYTTDIN